VLLFVLFACSGGAHALTYAKVQATAYYGRGYSEVRVTPFQLSSNASEPVLSFFSHANRAREI
jgi:hypothetical protein